MRLIVNSSLSLIVTFCAKDGVLFCLQVRITFNISTFGLIVLFILVFLFRRVKKEVLNFFGVGNTEDLVDTYIWQARRMRKAAKNFGHLRPVTDEPPSGTSAAGTSTDITDGPPARRIEPESVRAAHGAHVPFTGLYLFHPISTQQNRSFQSIPLIPLRTEVFPFYILITVLLPIAICV